MDEPDMRHVLACVDGSSATAAVCDWAVWAAGRLGAPLEFLHVVDHHPERARSDDLSGSLGLEAQPALMHELASLDEQRSRVALELGRRLLGQARARAAAAGIDGAGTRQRHGPLVEALQELEPVTRLAVLGPHRRERALPRIHLDHEVESVVRALRAPVLAASRPFAPPRNFLVAFDGSETGRRMVRAVAASPLLRGLDARLAVVGPRTAANLEQADWAHRMLEDAGFACTLAMVDGAPEEVLRAQVEAHAIDLLVMGAYGHSRIRELILGSVTTTLLRTSPAPVLILR